MQNAALPINSCRSLKVPDLILKRLLPRYLRERFEASKHCDRRHTACRVVLQTVFCRDHVIPSKRQVVPDGVIEMPPASTYLGFGAVISGVGIMLVIFHVRSQWHHCTDSTLTAADRKFYEKQYSRRLQTSGLLVTLGALIGGFGYVKALETSPVFATIYVIGLLVLTMWLVLLAISDVLATRIYISQLNRRSHNMQKSLEDALGEVREAHGLDAN